LEAAVKQVAEESGYSVSTVWSALRQHRGWALGYWENEEDQAMQQMAGAHEAIREEAIVSLMDEHPDRYEFTDEEVDARAEKLVSDAGDFN
jgi:hypothetical protein